MTKINDSTNSEFLFTVFTPTYNRGHLISRVYNSLCDQTFTNFEWVIIDDGSTDNTHEIVEKWREANLFPIHYYFQENQGKHIAWNKAADLARGQYFLCADSDDKFVSTALEDFSLCLNTIGPEEYDNYYGAVALCKTQYDEIVGSGLPENITDSDFLELYFKYKVTGEQWYCGRTQIHRQIRFMESSTKSCLFESTVWLPIGRRYRVKLLPKPLRVYMPEPDSICKTFSYNKHAPGKRALSLMVLNEYVDNLDGNLTIFLNYAQSYVRSCFHLGIPVLQQGRALNNMKARILWMMMLAKGYALYLYDMLQRK